MHIEKQHCKLSKGHLFLQNLYSRYFYIIEVQHFHSILNKSLVMPPLQVMHLINLELTLKIKVILASLPSFLPFVPSHRYIE